MMVQLLQGDAKDSPSRYWSTLTSLSPRWTSSAERQLARSLGTTASSTENGVLGNDMPRRHLKLGPDATGRTTTTTTNDAADAATRVATGDPASSAAFPAPLQESGSALNQGMDGVATTGPLMVTTGGANIRIPQMGLPLAHAGGAAAPDPLLQAPRQLPLLRRLPLARNALGVSSACYRPKSHRKAPSACSCPRTHAALQQPRRPRHDPRRHERSAAVAANAAAVGARKENAAPRHVQSPGSCHWSPAGAATQGTPRFPSQTTAES
jgi:hypothetical protein